MELKELIIALKRYNNRKMPDHIQKEIRNNWNRWKLYKYTDYTGVWMNLKK